MAKVIIFGNRDFAELAHFYLTTDSEHEVVAFTVHDEYIDENSYKGLPLVGFENITKEYPPEQFMLFAPMSGSKMNTLREEVYKQGKEMGFQYISYVSSKATHFGNEVGDNCFILENNTIQPFTTIGNNVVAWSGNHIGHHGRIGNHVTLTSHIVLSGHCIVEDYCYLGVNATIRDNILLAEGTLVVMASAIKRNTQPWSVYVGNPAKQLSGKSSMDIGI